MIIDKIINLEFKSNTYIIRSGSDEKSVIIIDPAGDQNYLLKSLEKNDFTPVYVILTHEHFDHITSTNSLKKKYPNSFLICSKICSERILNIKQNLSVFKGKPYVSVPADLIVDDAGFKVQFESLLIRCLPWQGHSPGGMLINIGDVLFSGDQFIKNANTITNLPGGNRQKLQESFQFLKTQFNSGCMVYPGHGDPFLISDLQSY